LTGAELDRAVDRCYDRLVALVESEPFDVAHPELVERTDPLAGRSTPDHHRRAARAFADSRTVPEINAGRAPSRGSSIPRPPSSTSSASTASR